jgi:hypothetical protein
MRVRNLGLRQTLWRACTTSLANVAGEGKFVRSGKPIGATLRFSYILDGSFLLFEHDDRPPNGYHAWAEWYWDQAQSSLVSAVEDVGGGLRTFHSPGWHANLLRWDGGARRSS